jgi:hypothetical protein
MRRQSSRQASGLRTATLVSAVALTLVAAGCGGGSGAKTGADSPQPTHTSTGSTAIGSTDPASPNVTNTSTPPTATPTKKPKKKNVVAWILGLGPGAPDGPPEFTAYRLLETRHCTQVFARVKELDALPETLYTGAAQACLAALTGRSDLWHKSATALATVSAHVDELSCMDRAAYALLARIVSLHKQYPDRTFVKSARSKFTAPPCPQIQSIAPDHGPPGAPVHLTGTNFDGNVADIRIYYDKDNSVSAEDITRTGNSVDFTMPPPPPAGSPRNVCIAVISQPDWAADGVAFTYADPDVGPAKTLACPPSLGSG